MKKYFWRFVILLILTPVSIWLVSAYVSEVAESKIYSSTQNIPKNKVGLLLGTIKELKSGYINLYYQNRINAAVELFNSGKIDYILVSGDNRKLNYDEPTTMKLDLIARGIPKERIVLDYAGFRTLDSVVRCKEVFGESKITVISQKFHNERALFIAKKNGIEAIGYNAKSVPYKYGKKVVFREYLARIKLMLDLLVRKKPKFLGEPIQIG